MSIKVTFDITHVAHGHQPGGSANPNYKQLPNDTSSISLMAENVIANTEGKKAALNDVVSEVAKGLTRDIKMQLAGGERPNRRTGDLQRHTRVMPVTQGHKKVVNTMDYASYVEFGTSRHRPYPYFFPNVRRWAPKFKVKLLEALGI